MAGFFLYEQNLIYSYNAFSYSVIESNKLV